MSENAKPDAKLHLMRHGRTGLLDFARVEKRRIYIPREAFGQKCEITSPNMLFGLAEISEGTAYDMMRVFSAGFLNGVLAEVCAVSWFLWKLGRHSVSGTASPKTSKISCKIDLSQSMPYACHRNMPIFVLQEYGRLLLFQVQCKSLGGEEGAPSLFTSNQAATTTSSFACRSRCASASS